MNDQFKKYFRWLAFAAVVIGSLISGGCKTDEPDNLSMRPWNAPKGWENGMPGGFTDRYR